MSNVFSCLFIFFIVICAVLSCLLFDTCYISNNVELQMEKDTINYMKYKMGFSQKVLLSDEAVPTKFHCQEDRKRRLSDPGPSREVFLKRQRIDVVTECLQSQRIDVGTECLQIQSAAETHASLQKDDDIQEIIQPEGMLSV